MFMTELTWSDVVETGTHHAVLLLQSFANSGRNIKTYLSKTPSTQASFKGRISFTLVFFYFAITIIDPSRAEPIV